MELALAPIADSAESLALTSAQMRRVSGTRGTVTCRVDATGPDRDSEGIAGETGAIGAIGAGISAFWGGLKHRLRIIRSRLPDPSQTLLIIRRVVNLAVRKS
jgi:hypothetical protein